MRIDVAVDEAGQADVLLPEDDPVAGEDDEEPHKPADARECYGEEGNPDPPGDAPLGAHPHCDAQWQRGQQDGQDQAVISQHHAEIPRDRCDGGWRRVAGFARFAKKKQHDKKHGEDAEGDHAIHVLDAEVAMCPRSEKRSGSAADVNHGVINRIADGANVFLRGAGGGADDAGFDQRDSERGEHENEADKKPERDRVAHGSQPGRANRADQEIRRAENEIGDGESAAESEAVGGGSSEDREKPYHAAEDTGQRARLLGGKIQLLLQIESERGEGAVVSEALENLRDVRDPEGPLKSGADFFEALREEQSGS